MILTISACVATGIAGWFARKVKESLRSARDKSKERDNQFGVAILPEVDDPRWEKGGQKCQSTELCIRFQMVLGKIKTCPNHGIWIDGVPILNYRNEGNGEMRQRAYAWKVRRAYQARIAMEAIEGVHSTEARLLKDNA